MSAPPKEPKPDEVRRGGAAALESTYLGVAPTAPEPARAGRPTPAGGPVVGTPVVAPPVVATPAPASPAPASPATGGSAIVATPMISVSDRHRRDGSPSPASPPAGATVTGSPSPAVLPQPVSPQAVATLAAPAAPAPARPSGLQGGWQSAGIPRLGPEQTALHGSPGAWPMPAQGTPPAPRVQPAAPQPTPQAPAARASEAPAQAATGLQHTALASDYLRGARELALGAEAPAPVQPSAAEAARQTAYSPVSTPAPPRPHRQEPPAAALHTQAPLGHLNATAASGSYSPPSPPPPTKGPPPTAELSSPAPIAFQATPQAPIQVFYAEPEPGHSPRSMGTQASVAPPPSELGASFHGPMAPVIHEATPAPAAVVAPAPVMAAQAAPMAQVASPVRPTAPQALAGTMLDRTPSIPGHAQRQGPPPPANPTLRFEQVPAPRSSLAQQGTAFNLHIPIEGGATQWGRTAVEPTVKAGPRLARARPSSQWRMVLLALLALLSVIFAAFGPELRDLAQAELKRRTEPSGSKLPAAADQTTLTNLPSPGARPLNPTAAAAPVAPAAPVVPAASAGAAAAAEPAGAVATPAAALGGPVAPSAAPAALPAVEATTAAEEPPPTKLRRGRNRERKAESQQAAAASPESKLAAEAGRHVLAARFAEALPLYRELQRDYPQNTAYAAMAKVLEQKLGGPSLGRAQP